MPSITLDARQVIVDDNGRERDGWWFSPVSNCLPFTRNWNFYCCIGKTIKTDKMRAADGLYHQVVNRHRSLLHLPDLVRRRLYARPGTDA